MPTLTLNDGMRLNYLEKGSGAPVLLLHGWPTSAYLWRDVMPAIARNNSVIALDLPGFGGSDKPVDIRYDFDLFDRVLTEVVDRLEMDPLGIAVHDLGGPIAVHWMLRNPGRVSRLALLNTLLYPDFRPDLIEFVRTLVNPATRDTLTNPEALADFIRLGLADESKLTAELRAAVAAPFQDANARLALALAGIGLHPRGFAEIADKLPTLDLPVRIIYGEQDRVLTDIATTVERVSKDIPHADVTALPHCGHFLQEDDPKQVGELLAEFFSR